MMLRWISLVPDRMLPACRKEAQTAVGGSAYSGSHTTAAVPGNRHLDIAAANLIGRVDNLNKEPAGGSGKTPFDLAVATRGPSWLATLADA